MTDYLYRAQRIQHIELDEVPSGEYAGTVTAGYCYIESDGETFRFETEADYPEGEYHVVVSDGVVSIEPWRTP